MSRFHVDQRVRIIAAPFKPLVGQVATVTQIDFHQPGCGCCAIHVDGSPDFLRMVMEENCLEPIDEGDPRSVGSWADCVYKPPGVKP